MDPKETERLLREAIEERDKEAAIEHANNLLSWLLRGGFSEGLEEIPLWPEANSNMTLAVSLASINAIIVTRNAGAEELSYTFTGKYPTLCAGELTVLIGPEKYCFGKALVSGGSVFCTEDWDEVVTQGPWTIDEWPDDFPENRKEDLLKMINEGTPQGCCGGCV